MNLGESTTRLSSGTSARDAFHDARPISSDVQVTCSNCGAGFSDLEARCPYCGTFNPNGAEIAYMQELENIKEVTDDLDDDVQGNLKASFQGNAKRIIRIYRWWMKQYPDLRFVVESVNPTRLTKGSYSDKKVVKLNKRLRAAFEPEGIWMDNYTVMLNQKIIKKSGYGFKDNYHYKWKTSKKMLRIVRNWVEENVK